MEVVDVLMLLGGRESFLLKSAMIHCATRFHWWRVKASENVQQNTIKTTREDERKKEFFLCHLKVYMYTLNVIYTCMYIFIVIYCICM